MTSSFCLNQPCNECPWRRDVARRRFPVARFVELADTCKQQFVMFACHKSSEEAGQFACVGFLLVEGHNNLAVRLAAIHKRFDPEKIFTTAPLFESFREMAVANGVEPDHPCFRGMR